MARKLVNPGAGDAEVLNCHAGRPDTPDNSQNRRALQDSAALVNAMRVLPVVGDRGHSAPRDLAAGPATMQPLAGPRFEHRVEHLHRLGPRATGELLIEIAMITGESDLIASRLQAYAELPVEIVHFLGADRFPPIPPELIR